MDTAAQPASLCQKAHGLQVKRIFFSLIFTYRYRYRYRLDRGRERERSYRLDIDINPSESLRPLL